MNQESILIDGYSVIVRTPNKPRFEPYRGPSKKVADRAFEVACERLKHGCSVELWKLERENARVILSFPPAA